MVTPITHIGERLRKLVLLLSSPQDGEVIGAARAIDRALRSAGCDWHDLVNQLDGTSMNTSGADQSRDWHPMRDYCLRHERLLRPREYEFVASLATWRGSLTERQQAWLASIYARIKRAA
jgi:hypothetical protein